MPSTPHPMQPPAPSRMHRLIQRKTVKWAAIVAVPLVASISFFAVGQSTPPAIPLIALATEPLYAASTADKPTLALALSVEYPTVGAQYPSPYPSGGSPDNRYDDSYSYGAHWLSDPI